MFEADFNQKKFHEQLRKFSGDINYEPKQKLCAAQNPFLIEEMTAFVLRTDFGFERHKHASSLANGKCQKQQYKQLNLLQLVKFLLGKLDTKKKKTWKATSCAGNNILTLICRQNVFKKL